MDIFGKSIKGRRNSNQDSIYFNYVNDAYIMAVADGVGGNLGGDIASQLTTSICKSMFKKFIENPKSEYLKSVIADIYLNSHQEILEIAKQDAKLSNMATTLTIVLGYKNAYVTGNIGDSRIYKLTNGTMKQVTKDHSYIQEYKDKYPDLPIDPFVKTQLGNVITRSINAKLEKIDILPLIENYFTLNENEMLLLCSDGLQPDKLVDKIWDFHPKCSSIDEFVDRLITFSFDNGSRDNISVIIGGKNNSFAKDVQNNVDIK